MKLLILADSFSACQWYRGLVPGAALGDAGDEVVYVEGVSDERLAWADTLLVIRTAKLPEVSAVKRAKESGVFVVCDVDDDLWSIGTHNQAHLYWTHPRLGSLVDVLRLADRVTTTTPALVDLVSRFSDDAVVLPNCLPDALWPVRERKDGPIVVGWAGSTSHIDDFSAVKWVLPTLLDRFSDIEVHLAGAQPSWFDFKHDRLKFLSTVNIESYSELVSGFDVGLAPLASTRFNKSKSDLKVLEYSACSIPSVASAHYASTPARIAKSDADWLKYVSALVSDDDLRARLGAEAREWAESRMISRNTDAFRAAMTR